MPEMNILIRAAAQREKLFIALYKNAFPSVAQYISKMGGSFDDAKDIFQDALVIYYEKAVASAIAINTNEKAYLVGISKHLWLRKFKDNSHNTSLDGIDITFNIDDDQPSESKLMHFLETAGKKCMELLRSFYYDQLPLADAAKLFGFSGVRSATVQKYKCLEKARETIKERSLTYEDFLN
ncbi:MAG: polymerase subunit sigma-70 [Mucilaginibacter sp.]|nr:polymerase subunit sigma-70 [Mucilaginibacter sp.]